MPAAKRRYFDNAATSFPKPPGVLQAMHRYATEIGASAGRGAYREALQAQQIITETRSRLARLIGAPDPNHVILTFNCTDGLSLAIKGLLTTPAEHVVTTRMEHNSVLRPLHALQKNLGIDVTYVPADCRGLVDPDDLRRAIRPNTRLIAVVHASNVCGSVQDIAAVSQIARRHEIPLLVDAAQTIGHLPIDLTKTPIDLLAFPGHKGLLGPLGTGGLYIRPGLEQRLRPLKEGGTGSRSAIPEQPDFLPDRFEAGSHNLIGIAGLGEAAAFLLERGIENLHAHESKLSLAFLEGAAGRGLTVHGPTDLQRRLGVFSVTVAGYEPLELAAILEERFGLLTRPGLHCAPFAHETLGTLDRGGTVRFSLGPFLEVEDVKYATEALVQIAQATFIQP